MPGLHTLHHPEFVEDCFGCKVLSIRMDRGGAKAIDAADRTLSADLAAYKRLRRDGLQPRHVDGSADLETKVEGQHDIDLGRYVPREEMARVQEGYAMAKELFSDAG